MGKQEDLPVYEGKEIPVIKNNNSEETSIQKSPTIESIIMAAVEKDANIETLERLMALKERYEKKQAEIAFNEAFVAFKGICPKIYKTKTGATEKNNPDNVYWKYAPLDIIEDQVKKPLSECGLSYDWNSEVVYEEKTKSRIRKTHCTLTHILGHSRTRTFESGIDSGTSAMNSIQKEGSTISYGERYSLLMVLGLAVKDEDDDGVRGAEVELTDEQLKELSIVESNKKLKTKLLKAYNIKDVEYLPADKFEECIKRINAYLDNEANKK